MLALACAAAPARAPEAANDPPPKPCPEAQPPAKNHAELFAKAKALRQKELWNDAIAAISEAEAAAPDHANYFFFEGYAWVKLGEADPKAAESAYARARVALRRCIALDPNVAECHHFLGEASLALGDLDTSLQAYATAIRVDPTVAYFYAPLADELIILKYYDEALGVITEGIRQAPVSDRTRNHLYALHVLSFQVYQARNDKKGMLRAMELAREVDGDRHPEILFNLGATYAVQDPPDRAKAKELLSSFFKRVCRGAFAAKYREQCQTSQALLQKLRL